MGRLYHTYFKNKLKNIWILKILFVYLSIIKNKKVMDKVMLLEKIGKGGFNNQQLKAWVECLPGSSSNRKPTFNKVGDVYMHPVFQHPYVLLEKRDGFWICGLITSESKCPEILEECRSRFIQGYLTKTIFTASDIQGSFMNNYDNTRHLKKVIVKLREFLK